MVDDEKSNLAGLRRKAAKKTPYPYFLERLEDIEAWLKAAFFREERVANLLR